jgi:DNA invertase Pin-like site-specific DNA recombinase
MTVSALPMVASALAQGSFASASPNDSPITGSGSYARYSSDNEDERSISDQQRKCNSHAVQNGSPIVPKLQFVDEAVSGETHSRSGFDAMLAAARTGILRHLYIESLSRLAATITTLEERELS